MVLFWLTPATDFCKCPEIIRSHKIFIMRIRS